MDEDGPTASIIIFVVLLLIDIFCFGFQAAMDALNEKEVERRAEENKDKKSLRLMRLIGNPTEYVNAVQVITTLTNVIIGAVHLEILSGAVSNLLVYVTESGLKLQDFSTGIIVVLAAVISTALLLYIMLTLGVIMPKKAASRVAEKWAYALVTPMCFVIILAKPLTGLVNLSTKAIFKIFGINVKDDEGDVTEEEIISMVNEGHEQGLIQASEAEMISNIFELGEKEARDIMTHRRNVSAVEVGTTLEEAIAYMLEEKYSRYPVYEEDIDHIIGILHLKDAMRFHAEGDKAEVALQDLTGLFREPDFVPQTKNIDALFREMQAKKLQMVIVVDEYGQTDGLIAMEDILEEIVGNILDEYDDESQYIEEKGNDEYVIEGMTPLEELEEKLKIEFDEEDSDTLNGFLISKLDKIPEQGDEFDVDYKGYNFKILSVEDKMIQSVLVTKMPEEEFEEEENN